jgi:hypothetical protein
MTKPKKKSPLLAALVVIGLIFTFNLFLSSKEWREMGKAYGYSGDFHGKCLEPTWVEIEFGYGGGEHSTFDICSNSEGFFFGTPLNIFGLKPIVVPWHDVSMHIEDRPAYQTVVLKFRLLPGYTFEFAKDAWDQLSIPKAELSPEP